MDPSDDKFPWSILTTLRVRVLDPKDRVMLRVRIGCAGAERVRLSAIPLAVVSKP